MIVHVMVNRHEVKMIIITRKNKKKIFNFFYRMCKKRYELFLLLLLSFSLTVSFACNISSSFSAFYHSFSLYQWSGLSRIFLCYDAMMALRRVSGIERKNGTHNNDDPVKQQWIKAIFYEWKFFNDAKFLNNFIRNTHML